MIGKLWWNREGLAKGSESSWFWNVAFVFGGKQDNGRWILSDQEDPFNKLLTFSSQKVQNYFSNHSNMLTSSCSWINFNFGTVVALAMGDAGRYPDSSRLCPRVWYKEKRNRGRKWGENKGEWEETVWQRPWGILVSAASEGLGPDVDIGPYSQGPGHWGQGRPKLQPQAFVPLGQGYFLKRSQNAGVWFQRPGSWKPEATPKGEASLPQGEKGRKWVPICYGLNVCVPIPPKSI